MITFFPAPADLDGKGSHRADVNVVTVMVFS